MTQNASENNATEAVEHDVLTATKETLEDYTLRFAPRSYRSWTTGVVAASPRSAASPTWPTSPSAPTSASPTAPTNALWGIASSRWSSS